MVYILGAGAMARETLDIYAALERDDEVQGFIVQELQDENAKICGRKVFDASVIDSLPKGTRLIGAMGNPVRYGWIEEIESRGFDFDTVVHPHSSIGGNVRLGHGCIVCPGAVLTCDIEIGRHVIVNVGSTISHDCRIDDYTTLAPGVNIAGRVTVGNKCWIGIGAAVLERRSVGQGAFVGAGAIVSKNLTDNVFAVGSPARVLRKLEKKDWRELI